MVLLRNIFLCLIPPLIFTNSLAFADVCEDWLRRLNQKADPSTLSIHLITLAENSMRKAGKSILELRLAKDFKIQQKKNFSDIKTQGDCTSQKIILTQLAKDKIAGKANFIAEEKCASTNSLTKSATSDIHATWILDPIDGTTNYVHGMPHFSISLALAVDSEICFGAVYAPVYEEFYFAWIGKGAFLKKSEKNAPERIQVSGISHLNSSLWITGTEGGPANAAKDKNRRTFEIASELLPLTHDMRRTGSASLDLASVASGKVEGYFELSEGLNWWDIAAGIRLVKEAGGKILTHEPNSSGEFKGPNFERPILFVLATNGQDEIHNGMKTLLLRHIPSNMKPTSQNEG